MHEIGGIRAEAGVVYTTFLPPAARKGSVRLEVHVQWSQDGRTYHQTMMTTTPDVAVEDGKLDWLVALKPEKKGDKP